MSDNNATVSAKEGFLIIDGNRIAEIKMIWGGGEFGFSIFGASDICSVEFYYCGIIRNDGTEGINIVFYFVWVDLVFGKIKVMTRIVIIDMTSLYFMNRGVFGDVEPRIVPNYEGNVGN